MTHSVPVPVRPTLLGHLLTVLRTATLERMILPDVEGSEMEEDLLLMSDATAAIRRSKATIFWTADKETTEAPARTVARKSC